MYRVGAYARVSTGREEQNTSIKYQKVMFNNFIEDNGWELTKLYVERETGTKENRPELVRLMQDLEEKNIDVVIFKDLSRLARNVELSYKITNLAKGNGIHIISLDGMIDTRKDDSDTLGLYAWVHERESQILSTKIKQTKRAGARIGKYQGSFPPYGYDAIKGVLYIRDDETPKIVKRIFTEYIKGSGFDTIAKRLTLEGVPTPGQVAGRKNAGTNWWGSTIMNILTNPHYTGNLVQARTETISVLSTKRKKNETDKMIVRENTHPPLISQDIFDTAQTLMNNRKRNNTAPKKNLFTNIVFCTDCGNGMWYRSNRRYICGNYARYGKSRCTSHSIEETELVKQLINDFDDFLQSLNLSPLSDKVKSKISKAIRKNSREISKLETKIKAIKNRKVNYAQMLANDTVDFDIEMYNIVIKKDNDKLDQYIDKVEALKVFEQRNKFDLSCVENDFKEYLYSPEVLPELIHRFVTKIEVRADGTPKVHYCFQKPNSIIAS